MANRKARQEIAKQTLLILDKGNYTSHSGQLVEIIDDIKHCNENSHVYNAEKLSVLSSKLPTKLPGKTKFEVTTEFSISACLRLTAEAVEGEKICCLNFASAKNPCGGMVNGSIAQEESLALCSSLHSCLTQFMKEYYDINRNNPKDGIYHDNLIYSPNCVVFREDTSYQLLAQPVKINFISSAAVNAGVALKRKIPQQRISDAMSKRVHNVLAVAADTGQDVLILGAWGCGVFRNDPSDIAEHFAQLLHNPDGKFNNVFRKVVFAIGSDNNKAATFRSKFPE